MSGDSVPFPLPLQHLATSTGEATALYGELRKPLLRYLVCLGLSADEAQDVVQEAFLSLHRHLSACGSKEHIKSWLFRVAHNRARNQQNRYDRRFGRPLEDDMDSISGEATPEQAVLEKEKFRRLSQAMNELAETEKSARFWGCRRRR
jgi:RNA polymerase sigma-70 factor (ECF subfamily)